MSDADQKLFSSVEKDEKLSSSWMLDSHIISASFFKKTPIGSDAVKKPSVKITFQHLSSGENEHICVYWDPEEENWSDSGCEVLKTNLTHTTCGCQHLTHFGILSLVENSGLVGNGLDFGFISANSESKEAQHETVITLEIATYLVSTVCLLILIIIIVQVRQI